MHFTREPIIETVITAREGYRLAVRNTKDKKEEEFTAEAVEVVSFGPAIFFRCLERPKCFLLPVSDYEIVEVKEQRISLKTSVKAVAEKSSKGQQTTEKTPPQKKSAKRKSKKKRAELPKQENNESKEEEKKVAEEDQSVVFSKLFPPPATLIKEQLGQSIQSEIIDANIVDAAEERKEERQEPAKPEASSGDFPEPEPLDQPIFNPDFLEEKEETPEEVTKNEQ